MNYKYSCFLFLFCLSVFSQTPAERTKIIKSSDPVRVEALKKNYFDYTENQRKLIDEYLSLHRSEIADPSSLQRIIDGVPIFYTTDNADSAASIRGTALYPGGSLGLNVTGSGMTAGVWDGGMVRSTHVEFSNRVTINDSGTSLSQHGTHVTGTIIAQGLTALSRRGLAYQANAFTHDWTSDVTEMISFAGNGYLVSNHSYGIVLTNSTPSYLYGSYSSSSAELDDIMYTYPYYQVVKAAGNDRNDFTLNQVLANQGYDLLSGWSTAKNVITVAAVEDVLNYSSPIDVVMSSFSNFGPPDDGRVKPDIAANGVSVTSCNSVSNTAFVTLQGTSMASPAITGLILLLQKHYNNLNASAFMKSASVRGVLFHSTREAGQNVGPDYQFGWGLADGYEAARVISGKGNNVILDERVLNNGETYTRPITINTTQDVKVTISWTDPAGNSNGSAVDNRTPRLKNNLDLKVLKDGNVYYPWKLDPTNPGAAATNDSDNNADNTEKIEIFNAEPGTYTIQVNHKGTLQSGSQEYTLVASSTNGLSLNSETFVADNNFFVYPSPADNTISYSNPNNYTVSSISIADISGKQVMSFSKNAVPSSIDVSNLQSGVYFVTFTSDNLSTVKKFIKK